MNLRTSISDPLQIAAIELGSGLGRIGITLCPGKQRDAMTGQWSRDLSADADGVRGWGASVVVTLIEDHETEAPKASELGLETGRHMDWLHLPIADASVPSTEFEQAWYDTGEGLRARLRDGFDVLVHCKGGLSRAVTIAARLMVELGACPNDAIAAVRTARPGAIQNLEQESFIRALSPVPERQPSTSDIAIRDRAIGALLGLAVGDAVGTTLEFKKRDDHPLLTDMVGGGPFALNPGEWTDDTAMALALAVSLNAHPDLNEQDLMSRFVAWHENGDYSCTGRCFDIGITTQQALSRWKKTGDPIAGSTDPWTAGNGSLMRLAPVAIRHWQDRARLRDVAARQSRTTHDAPEAIEACVAFAEMLADAIEGRTRTEVLRPRTGPHAGKIDDIVKGSWRGRSRDSIASSGYVAHSLEASLWCVGRTGNYRSAILSAANLADDADTTAAITGQLSGALYGASGIPKMWRKKVAWSTRIERMALDLLQC